MLQNDFGSRGNCCLNNFLHQYSDAIKTVFNFENADFLRDMWLATRDSLHSLSFWVVAYDLMKLLKRH